MDLDIADHVVLVTGASAGIGQSVCAVLHEEGAIPVGIARTAPATTFPGHFIAKDLSRAGASLYAVEETLEKYGRIDGLVNNVGALHTRPGFLDITNHDWHTTWELNFMSAVEMCRFSIPHMLQNGSGSIVHITSEAARLADPTMTHYAVTKTALLSMSKALAAEFSPRGIRSNVVAPGPTRTRLWDEPGGFAEQLARQFDLPVEDAIHHFVDEVRSLPTRSLGKPEDVAHIVSYLLSPLASQVTGAEWAVDGGALPQI